MVMGGKIAGLRPKFGPRKRRSLRKHVRQSVPRALRHLSCSRRRTSNVKTMNVSRIQACWRRYSSERRLRVHAIRVVAIRDDTFLTEVLQGGGAPDAPHSVLLDQFSHKDQRSLRAWLDRTTAICTTISGFSFEYGTDEVRACSDAFLTIATLMPAWDGDELGAGLRVSYIPYCLGLFNVRPLSRRSVPA